MSRIYLKHGFLLLYSDYSWKLWTDQVTNKNTTVLGNLPNTKAAGGLFGTPTTKQDREAIQNAFNVASEALNSLNPQPEQAPMHQADELVKEMHGLNQASDDSI